MAVGALRSSKGKSPIFGIDLGTSNCCVALWAKGKADIVHNLQGERTTPSVVAIDQTGTFTIGASARRQAVMNPKDTIGEVKRLVGLRFKSAEVAKAREVLPYDICEATNGDAWVRLGGHTTSPQEIQAHILEELARAASKFAGTPAERVIITVPAFFDETQRQAVRDSARIAGLRAERIISEPTAAALAYGYAQYDDRRIAIVDLGGGTFDVTIMSVNQGRFEVLATDGDNYLGGADFDRCLALHFADQLEAEHGVDVRSDPVAMQRLLSEAEAAKKALSNQSTVHIRLPYLLQRGRESIDFDFHLPKATFEALTAPLVERVAAPCQRAVAQAKLRPADLDEVILVGGMTRSPVIQTKITELFQRQPLSRVNPDEAVAIGASLLGASLMGELDEVTFVDVAPRSIGLKAAGDKFVPLIRKSTPLPARCRKGFRTTRDQQVSFELDILQGESAAASANRRLAHIVIEPITKKPAGEVVLAVEFEVDECGALSVGAKEQGSSSSIHVTVEPFSGLTDSQVERLAAEHAAKRRPAVDLSNQVDEMDDGLGGFSISISSARKESPLTQAAAAPSTPSTALTEDTLFGDLVPAPQEAPVPASVDSPSESPSSGAPVSLGPKGLPEESLARDGSKEPSESSAGLPVLWLGVGAAVLLAGATLFLLAS